MTGYADHAVSSRAWRSTTPGAAIRCRGTGIVGIVTTGKGVTIHTRDCQTLESFAATPERFIDVEWDLPAVGQKGGSEGNGKGCIPAGSA